MVRRGRFALMNGKEYELISYQHQYYLKSTDIVDLQLGFIDIQGTAKEFTKKVSVEDLEDAYEVFPYAMLIGYRFAVEGYNKKTGNVRLVTSNPFVKKKIDVRAYRKDEYIIELPYEDVVIQEDRIPILGFENIYWLEIHDFG